MDANLSYRVARALATVQHPFIHVTDAMPEYVKRPGQSAAPDHLVAPWCAEERYVLVTTDQGFQGRWVRTGLLAKHGVEVIVYLRDIEGLPEQHRLVTKHLPEWKRVLGLQPYGYRIWEQPLLRGALRERRSKYRPPSPTGP